MRQKIMFEKLEKLEERYRELEHLLASPEIVSDKDKYAKFAKEMAGIKESVSLFRQYRRINKEIGDLEGVLKERHEKAFLELAQKELRELEDKKLVLEEKLKNVLKNEDEDIGRDVIVEIRAGTGGQEAGLFARDLFRMYTKYAAKKNWILEELSVSPTELGGFKEVVFSVKGPDAYKRLKFESGVHRVQRVPETEAQGRIHTSTATVAVLVEPEEIELVIDPKDLKIDTYRSSGPGGQHMQKTDSAVRITHLPSGIVVSCQDERSQTKNKNKAMRILRARLLDMKQKEEFKRITQERRLQIGSGERSEKIRTYNFPDRRVTDHRINLTLYKLEAIIDGDLDELSDALIKHAQSTQPSEGKIKD
ncbi:MAG: peptide chain release factor 1 [Candidatus Omnitrophica bacterium]|nr:peptide chain release factor 1 [Candidatus Omnitrophota bacterium]